MCICMRIYGNVCDCMYVCMHVTVTLSISSPSQPLPLPLPLPPPVRLTLCPSPCLRMYIATSYSVFLLCTRILYN